MFLQCSTARSAAGVVCGFLPARLLKMLPVGVCVQGNVDLCLVVINGEILGVFPLREIKLKFSFVTLKT